MEAFSVKKMEGTVLSNMVEEKLGYSGVRWSTSHEIGPVFLVRSWKVEVSILKDGLKSRGYCLNSCLCIWKN